MAWYNIHDEVINMRKHQVTNSGLDEMETWLITPPVTNIQDKTLSFKSAIAYWTHGSDHPGSVLVSELILLVKILKRLPGLK